MKHYLTPKEVSDHFGGRISTRTLANWRSIGNVGPKFLKLGGKILYPAEEIAAWEQRRTVSGTTEYKK